MSDEYEIECTECGWSGDYSHLVCSDEDFKSQKDCSDIKFNICPDCGSVDSFEELEPENEIP